MSVFAKAVLEQKTLTTNGMAARVSSASACTDLFFKIGASRGKNIIPQFVAAFVENQEYALRILQWARDIRGGAGERQLFRQVIQEVCNAEPELGCRILNKVPEIGRWDDLLLDFKMPSVQKYVHTLILDAIKGGNGLAAKWMPRKGTKAIELRKAWKMSPKAYRKFIVNASKTVEQQMCAKDWNGINFSQVPSLAASRYRTAFFRNAEERFMAYVEDLKSGRSGVKINAGAVYPYDILKGLYRQAHITEVDHRVAQWDALENYIGDANILPMVDVSGSMFCPAGGNPNLTCADVAISLGLYCAEKNRGVFKDLVLTFSENPQLEYLKGNIVEKYRQLRIADWGMNTDLNRAFDKILTTALNNKVPAEEMPSTLVIFSDMQFDASQKSYGGYYSRSTGVSLFNESAIEMIRQKYSSAGYDMPQIVFWNLNAHENVPVQFNELGVALVSGFSPAIMKAVLDANPKEFTPEAIMKQAIMVERYNY